MNNLICGVMVIKIKNYKKPKTKEKKKMFPLKRK